MIDLTGTDDAVAAVNALSECCDAGSHLVVLGALNDIGFYRRLIELGVQDYLVKPVTVDQLEIAFARSNLRSEAETHKPDPIGDLYVVSGVRGGIRASTTALNIA